MPLARCAPARIIAQRHVAPHLHTLILRGGNLVADPLTGDLALELGKGQQDIQGLPTH